MGHPEQLAALQLDLAKVKYGSAAWSIMVRLAMRPDPELWLRAQKRYQMPPTGLTP